MLSAEPELPAAKARQQKPSSRHTGTRKEPFTEPKPCTSARKSIGRPPAGEASGGWCAGPRNEATYYLSHPSSRNCKKLPTARHGRQPRPRKRTRCLGGT